MIFEFGKHDLIAQYVTFEVRWDCFEDEIRFLAKAWISLALFKVIVFSW
jgi:hypothetical protein